MTGDGKLTKVHTSYEFHILSTYSKTSQVIQNPKVDFKSNITEEITIVLVFPNIATASNQGLKANSTLSTKKIVVKSWTSKLFLNCCQDFKARRKVKKNGVEH